MRQRFGDIMSKRNEASKPEVIFMMKGCIREFGVLQAAIIADVMYWIVQGKEPWIKAQKHADWFYVNEKTIRTNSKELAEHRCFGRRTSHLKNGKKGACKYFPIKSTNYKTIYNFYFAMFNRENKTTDLGKFAGCDTQVKEVADFVTFPLIYLDEIGDITTAYLLAKLHWVTFSDEPSLSFRYSSKSTLARAMNLNRTTMGRHLEWLSNNCYIDYQEDDKGNGIKIRVNESIHLYSEMLNWVEANQQKRREGVLGEYA